MEVGSLYGVGVLVCLPPVVGSKPYINLVLLFMARPLHLPHASAGLNGVSTLWKKPGRYPMVYNAES